MRAYGPGWIPVYAGITPSILQSFSPDGEENELEARGVRRDKRQNSRTNLSPSS